MTNTLRPGLPPLPQRIADLPIDERGYPVPWFVAWIDGKPEFRAMDAQKLEAAIKAKRCWVCGDVLGRNMAFVIGPMCAINRISGEPPSHSGCAEFAVMACPFMLMPKMRRRQNDLPEDVTKDEAHLDRNPGVTLLWVTRSYTWFRRPEGNVLFEIGDPIELSWWCEGRAATRSEVLNSITTGLPALIEIAQQEGPKAVMELGRRHGEVLKLVDNTVTVASGSAV